MISHICGGLGNQMFQYAAGYSAAKRLNVPYRLNLNFYKADWEPRVYLLDNFKNIDEEITEDKEDPITEPHFHYSPIDKDGSIYGYRQSERYFIDYKNEIRNKFYLPKINITDDYVMVSVRRADYLQEPGLYNILDSEYYDKARSYFPGCKFIGFTEDTEWMEENLPWLDEISTGKSAIQDFQLMCSFKKFIIANSTFSWWAAWLSDTDEVVAPKIWFVDQNYNTNDLIPERWAKI